MFFWTVRIVVGLCRKQDSLMSGTAAFVYSTYTLTLTCYKLYWTIQMLITRGDPAVIGDKTRYSLVKMLGPMPR